MNLPYNAKVLLLATAASVGLAACNNETSAGSGTSGTTTATGGGSGIAGSGGGAGGGLGGVGALGSGGASGGSTADGGGFSAEGNETWNGYCEERARMAEDCGTQPPSCASAECAASLFSEEGMTQYVACQSAKDCATFLGDDDCISSAGLINGELPPARQAILDRCAAKIAECDSSADDFCALVAPIFRADLAQALDACLRGSCGELDECFAAIGVPDCL